jgi:hypothetical protein
VSRVNIENSRDEGTERRREDGEATGVPGGRMLLRPSNQPASIPGGPGEEDAGWVCERLRTRRTGLRGEWPGWAAHGGRERPGGGRLRPSAGWGGVARFGPKCAARCARSGWDFSEIIAVSDWGKWGYEKVGGEGTLTGILAIFAKAHNTRAQRAVRF